MPLRYPLIPVALFKNYRFLALAGVASVGTMFYYSLTVIWPQMIASQYTQDSIIIGLMSGTVGGGTAFGQALGGFSVRLGWGHWQLRVAAIFMCAFVGAMAACDASMQSAAIAFSTLGAFMVGIVEVVPIIAVPFVVAPNDIGLASGVLGSSRAGLGTVALAIFSSVLTTRKTEEIPPRLNALALQDNLNATSTAQLIKAGLAGSIATVSSIPGIPAERVARYILEIQDGAVSAYKTVFLASLAFGGFAVICACFAQPFNQYFTNKVDKRLGGVTDLKKDDSKSEKLPEP